MKKLILPLLVASFVTLACDNEKGAASGSENESATVGDQGENTLTVQEKEEGWMLLFDGKSAAGWRGYNQTELPQNWVVDNGTLKSLGEGGDVGGDIVYGDREFGNFEIIINWKIEVGGNSGLFYHVVEGEEYPVAYHTAPEYQMIDQIGFPQQLETWQSLGGDYGMYDPDYEGAVKSAGEWNTTRVVFTENEVSYWLNEKKTLSFKPWSEDWEKRKESGKWKDFPDYGKAKSGLIGLQDHGSQIWFKNIKIREL